MRYLWSCYEPGPERVVVAVAVDIAGGRVAAGADEPGGGSVRREVGVALGFGLGGALRDQGASVLPQDGELEGVGAVASALAFGGSYVIGLGLLDVHLNPGVVS